MVSLSRFSFLVVELVVLIQGSEKQEDLAEKKIKAPYIPNPDSMINEEELNIIENNNNAMMNAIGRMNTNKNKKNRFQIIIQKTLKPKNKS